MTQHDGPASLPFVYDRSDFAALARVARPRIVGWLFKVVWVLVAVSALLIAAAAALGDPVSLEWVGALVALTIAAVAIDRFGPELAGWVQLVAARRSGLLQEQRITAGALALRAESPRGLSELNWTAVPRVHFQADRVFVFVTRAVAFVVPRRAFASDEDFRAFSEAVRQRWAARHRL